MSFIDDMKAKAVDIYDWTVRVEDLAALRSREGMLLGLRPHRQLAADILARHPVDDAHPYHAVYKRGPAAGGWSWDDLLAYRRRTILGIRKDGYRASNPVELFVDDRGVAYYHGYHRLATMLELGRETIPVKVYVCGEHLPAVVAWVLSRYDGEHQRSLYQPIAHPLFSLLPVQRANSLWAEKVSAVVAVVEEWSGPVVEVGAHLGMLTRELLVEDVDVRAIDIDSSYLQIQPALEGIGMAAIPYEQLSWEQMAARGGECRIVCMGLMHHFTGKASMWERFEDAIGPWLRESVPEMIVEMSLLDRYQGETPAVAVTSDAAVEVLWWQFGYDRCVRLVEGSMSRVTYHLSREEDRA